MTRFHSPIMSAESEVGIPLRSSDRGIGEPFKLEWDYAAAVDFISLAINQFAA